MTSAAQPPPDDPVWHDIRQRYEAGTETVKAIAACVGMSGIALSMRALRQGWTMRGIGKAKPAARKPAAETTAATLKRMKDLLQSRLTDLETQLKDLSADVSELSSERNIRSMNLLVRTLDKVLDLERKDRLRRQRARRAFQHFDDSERAALADKLERLQTEWHAPPPEPDSGGGGGPGTEPPVALLGAAKPAASAGGD